MSYYNENILQHLHRVQSKKGISYARPEGVLSGWLKWLYYIFAVYEIVINAMIVLGMGMTLHDAREPLESSINSVITVAVFTLVIAVCCFLQNSPKSSMALVFGALNLISCVAIATAVYLMTDKENLKWYINFIWRNALPLFCLLALGTAKAVLVIRCALLEKAAYDKMVDNLYEVYSADFESLTDEQWEEFLDTYEPARPQKLKRSRKARAKKEQEKL